MYKRNNQGKRILVILADSEKARFIRVENRLEAYEETEKAFSCQVPEYSDKPGRTFESFGVARHALSSAVDRKEQLCETMAIELHAKIKKALEEENYESFFLFTEPKLEGIFKKHSSKHVLHKMEKVFHKNWTKDRFEDVWKKIQHCCWE